MKKIISSIKTLAALFVAGAAMTACTNDELVEPANTTKTYTLTVNASKGGYGGQTRAINLDGKTLNATWATGETVYVKKSGSDVGTLSPDADGVSTMLKGTLTGEFAIGNTLDLTFPRATVDYSGQVGTLSDIAEKYDYATATATISSISGSTINADNGSGEAVEFENQQAIVKFTLLQSDGSALPSNPTSVSISYGTGSVSLTSIPAATYTTNGNGVLYVAIPGFSGQDVIVTAAVGSTAYTFKQSNVTFINGKYYAIGVRMTENADLATPLTFEAGTAGTSVTFTAASGMSLSLEYSKNNGTWTTYSGPITLSNVGDKVSFRGDNATYNGSHFSSPGDCYVYGNVMSLVNSTGYAASTTLTSDFTFRRLFYQGEWGVLSHPTKNLVLPATKLTNSCYYEMFYGCDELTRAPELPATTLAESCYYCMFTECKNLAAAPELPATTLAESCYAGMFNLCWSLSSAPELPATTLAEHCYESMFFYCKSLTTAPELPATSLADYCYNEMFSNCLSLTTAPEELPATSLAEYCYKGMFQSCLALKTAPDLPASKIMMDSYSQMFYGCTNLNSVKCLATEDKYGSTSNWLYGVSSSGTFTKATGASFWTTGNNGIPSGWTVINE